MFALDRIVDVDLTTYNKVERKAFFRSYDYEIESIVRFIVDSDTPMCPEDKIMALETLVEMDSRTFFLVPHELQTYDMAMQGVKQLHGLVREQSWATVSYVRKDLIDESLYVTAMLKDMRNIATCPIVETPLILETRAKVIRNSVYVSSAAEVIRDPRLKDLDYGLFTAEQLLMIVQADYNMISKVPSKARTYEMYVEYAKVQYKALDAKDVLATNEYRDLLEVILSKLGAECDPPSLVKYAARVRTKEAIDVLKEYFSVSDPLLFVTLPLTKKSAMFLASVYGGSLVSQYFTFDHDMKNKVIRDDLGL